MEARAGTHGPGDMMLDRIFVYGTLRPSGHAFHLVQPFVVRHCPAVLTGYALVGRVTAIPGA